MKQIFKLRSVDGKCYLILKDYKDIKRLKFDIFIKRWLKVSELGCFNPSIGKVRTSKISFVWKEDKCE